MRFITMYNEYLERKIDIQYFVCVCVCAMLVCTCMIGCTYLCTCICRPDVRSLFLQSFTLLYEIVSSLNFQLTLCARLPGCQAFGIHLSSPHQDQDCRHCHYNYFFYQISTICMIPCACFASAFLSTEPFFSAFKDFIFF